MRCERAQTALSERMDGEHLPNQLAADLDAHLAKCGRCQGFATRADRIRSAMRLHAVEPVPDLVEPIMELLAEEPAAGRDELASRRARHAGHDPVPRDDDAQASRRRAARRLAPIAAALVVGLIAGSLLVGGPFARERGAPTASALDIPREVVAQAAGLDEFRARYRMVQVDPASAVPRREFIVQTWLKTPDRFRMEVAETTDAKRLRSSATPANDLTYVADRTGSLTRVPDCTAGPECTEQTTIVTKRPPFSSSSSLPTDLVLPLTAIGSADQIPGLERGTVEGREAVLVELAFEQAEPLFPFLGLGDRWRNIHGSDRVRIWLDRTGWFPIRVDVFPNPSADRRSWAGRNSVIGDLSGESILSLRLLNFSREVDDVKVFDIDSRGDKVSEHARPVDVTTLAGSLAFGIEDVERAAGLDTYGAAEAPAGNTGEGEQVVVAYARGMSWLKISQTSDWNGPGLFGGVEATAEQVELPNGGVGYFEPGAQSIGRRLAIHTTERDFVIETNLPRERLLRAAQALTLPGREIPPSWSSAPVVTPSEALAGLDFDPNLLPIPAGYVLSAAEPTETAGVVGATFTYRPQDTGVSGPDIEVHVERGTVPSTAEPRTVEVLQLRNGRFTGSFDLLEWNQGGVYYSIRAEGEGLERLVALAMEFERDVPG
ncbi:MAG: zf-HC2 domain-containing protein [Actinomycetota bacterium]